MHCGWNSGGGRYFGWVVIGALPFTINQAEYRERLEGMWLAEAVANWTGLTTELEYNDPPFLTDADWGAVSRDGDRINFVFQDPWLADDDTDVEYVYLHLLDRFDAAILSPAQISEGWRLHMDDEFLWESNQSALDLMRTGILPPSTGLLSVNPKALLIDAQLTTEFFGAFAPGMPGRALELADLPIRTTAWGHAAHAAQFHVLLYALAPLVDRTLPAEEQMLWLIDRAAEYFPPESKAMDIVRFVRDDYLSNPDRSDWERTRDRVYTRYHAGASANGFVYRGKFESSVNFACGIVALLYGGGNIPRTIQIGTLAGWDSDNPTATMGGLLGLLYGRAEVERQFGRAFSDRFDIDRTRNNLPDYLPEDAAAGDTFALMAGRMLPIVDRVVGGAGGSITEGVYTLPPSSEIGLLLQNPLTRLWHSSANYRFPSPTVFSSGNAENAWRFANGEESDFSGREFFDTPAGEWRSPNAPGGNQWLQVVYPEEMPIGTIRFIEGSHSEAGGWFESLVPPRLLTVSGWVVPEVSWSQSEALDSGRPYQIIDFTFERPMLARGVWLEGTAGGRDGYVTCLELDAFAE